MKRFAARALIPFSFALAGLPAPTPAATISVNSTADDFDQAANGNCTLREAIRAANTNAAVDGCAAGEPGPGTVDVVAVPAGTYSLTIGPRGDDASAFGDLDLTDDVEIQAAGADLSSVDAGRIDRVFEIHGGITALIADLEIRGGDSDGATGGGVQNHGDLTLERVAVTDTRAEGSGGGIRNNGQLTVRSSLLDANLTADHGGGIDNHGTAAFENTTVSGNDGGNLGGGLYNLGGQSLTMAHCTVVGNTAGDGQAIHNAGDLTAGNNLIVGPCSGTVSTTTGGNLESPGNICGLGGGDLVNVADPLLGALAANGGTTRTHALLAGSPAIDTGAAGPCVAVDQRGVARPLDGDGDGTSTCDVGAYEAASLTALIFADGLESGDISAWQLP